MNALAIVAERLGLLLIFILIFIFSYLGAEIFYRRRKAQATAWGEKLDGGRKSLIEIIYKNMKKPWGIFRAVVIMFVINLFGGAFLWSTIGGIFIVFPFLHYILIGFLVNLALKRYPERKHWLVIPNVIFEVGAFMVAALGGVQLGLSIVGGGDISLAVYQWGLLFIKLVVPLQIIAAIFEGLLLHQIHVVKKHPWPHGISE